MPITDATQVIPTLLTRNATFARDQHAPALRIMPSAKLLIVGCVDPRVEPADLLGLEPGEAAVLRNVGGRITPTIIEEIALLRGVSQASGGQLGGGWNLVVLHHTDCGIKRIAHDHAGLGHFFGVAPEAVEGLAISDPHRSVELDVAALRASTAVPRGFLVSGLVYDIATGTLEVVVPPELLG